METLCPRALRSRPSEAAVMPLPSELTTPPVKKIYFAISGCFGSPRIGWLPGERYVAVLLAVLRGLRTGFGDARYAPPALHVARFSELSPSVAPLGFRRPSTDT